MLRHFEIVGFILIDGLVQFRNRKRRKFTLGGGTGRFRIGVAVGTAEFRTIHVGIQPEGGWIDADVIAFDGALFGGGVTGSRVLT